MSEIKAGDTVKLTGGAWPLRTSTKYKRGSEHVVTRVEGNYVYFDSDTAFHLTDNWNMEVVPPRPKVGDKVLISEDGWSHPGEIGTLAVDDRSNIPFGVKFQDTTYDIWFTALNVTKVEEENNMNEFQPGDHIKATRKDNSKVTVTDVVLTSSVNGRNGGIDGEVFYFPESNYNFELLERPYKLPTERGIYVVDSEGLTDADLSNRKTYTLDCWGMWSTSGGYPATHDGVVDRLTSKKAKMVRLTLEK